MKYLLLVFVLVGGCAPWSTNPTMADYDLARDATLDVWTENIGDITVSRDLIDQVKVQEVSEAQLKTACYKIMAGCYDYENEVLLINETLDERQKERVCSHEWIHFLSRYELSDPQFAHNNGKLFNTDYSVEKLSQKILRNAL